METYLKLREQYPRFFYRGYKIEESKKELKLTYSFEIEGLSSFRPEWIFPRSEGDRRCWKRDRLLQEMVFSLGLVELVSYWKLTCSPQVVVEAGALSQEQIDWWKDLYFNGLGEFFYINRINEARLEDFMEIKAGKAQGAAGDQGVGHGEAGGNFSGEAGIALRTQEWPIKGVLVPIGGGKDSAVTLELMRQAGEKLYAYVINPRGATLHTAEVAGLDAAHRIHVKRTLDINMLELNRKEFLNGHTPFSALVAFSSILAARLYDLPYVALSNESSANESTVQGSTVNHQYSKSFKFEADFHRYAEEYLQGSAYYFSMLRPLSEYQIARYFASQKQYHSIFRSCNAGSKTDSWCGRCPKCLFVYLILSPFLTPEEMVRMFGRNILEDETMKVTLEQLVGLHEEKPFECVGSRDEINTAIVQTIDRMDEEGRRLPALLAYYKTTGLYQRYKAAGNLYSSYYDEENLVPARWVSLVKDSCVDVKHHPLCL